MFKSSLRGSFLFRWVASVVNLCFIFSFMIPVRGWAQTPADLGLPKPGVMVNLSSAYGPMLIKGLRVHPENPLLFDFIVDTGNSQLTTKDQQLKTESERLIKYFLASLTIPENDLWVNLSPYEKNRIIPKELGQTEMGRDMLAEDYILKQLTASMIYPEKNLGKEFWNKVYAKAQQLYGNSQIPVNTFNKVWIVADKAKVYVHANTAFVVASHLKVMLEEDYLALQKNVSLRGASETSDEAISKKIASSRRYVGTRNDTHSIASQIVRELVLPALETEVNTGKNFATLRQIFHSMILAAWYKKNLKEALLNQVYSNKAKINGVDVPDKTIKEQIYQQYLKAYKKGVFNYIKEDDVNGQVVPRKYFSGGVLGIDAAMVTQVVDSQDGDVRAWVTQGPKGEFLQVSVKTIRTRTAFPKKLNTPAFFTLPFVDEKGKVVGERTRDRAMVSEVERLGFSPTVIDNIKAGVITSSRHIEVLKGLAQIGEQDLLNGWEDPGTNDDKKRAMLDQIAEISEFVAGGFARYKETALKYFDILKYDRTPFEGSKAEVPEGIDLTDPQSSQFEHYSRLGMQNVNRLGFALVAGGMGERLGILGERLRKSGGAKIEIHIDPIAEQSYIASFAERIIALQDAYNKDKPADQQIKIPFFLMTSDETHVRTVQLFQENNNFGFEGVSVDPTPEQIARGELKQVVIARQKSVPAMKNSSAKFTTVPGDPYRMETKPHNHVDIHRLLDQTGVAKYWEAIGKTHLVLFQDTNGQAFNAIPAFAGVTIEKDYDGNILTVNRRPGDNVGCIVKMVNKNGRAQTYNVEYNQIAGVLKSMGKTEKDFSDEQGNSLFPGNINVLMLKLSTYNRILQETGGSFAEMLNIKGDDLKNLRAAVNVPGKIVEFQKHPRLEAMMQDIFKDPLMKNVGFTKFSNAVGFMATKNSFENALKAVANGNMPESLPWAQGGYYRHQRFLAAQAGVKIDVEGQQVFVFEGDYSVDLGGGKVKHVKGIPFQEGAYLSLPYMLPFQAKEMFRNGGKISPKSFLVVKGGGEVVFDRIDLDGTLVVNTVAGSKVTVRELSVKNEGWRRIPLTDAELKDPQTPMLLAMQGYKFEKTPANAKIINITDPGEYEVGPDGTMVTVRDRAMVVEPLPRNLTNGTIEERGPLQVSNGLYWNVAVRRFSDGYGIFVNSWPQRSSGPAVTSVAEFFIPGISAASLQHIKRENFRTILQAQLSLAEVRAQKARLLAAAARRQADQAMMWTDVQGDIAKWLPLAQKVALSDINQDMFRDYDYRYVKDGVPLKPEIVFIQALVWAKMALQKAQVAGIKTRDVLVARDTRKIEPEIVDAEIAALRYAGLNVVFVGDQPNCATSYSWAVQSKKWLMTIFNTASHVSQPENMVVRGFKVTQLGALGGNVLSLTTKEIKNESLALVKEMLVSNTGIREMKAAELGTLTRKSIEADAIRFNTAVGLVAANNGSLYQLGQDIKQRDADAQVQAVIDRFGQNKPLAGLKVVVEGSHTPSGPLAAEVFRNLGAEVDGLNLDVQEIFGLHSADPSIDNNLEALKRKIIETHANFGIAFDLDGDRGAILIPEWNTDGTTAFHILAPDNILGMLMPSLLNEWGYAASGKRVGVIRDVLGTYGVNDAARHNGIEMFQTDAGYVHLKALKERMEPQGYVFPVYGERSGHTWLHVSGEIENPIAVAILFSIITTKDRDRNPSDINGVLNLYRRLSIPYSQSPRFQPFYHPQLLQWLSEHNNKEWKYVPGVNPLQAIVALGNDEVVKRLSDKFSVGTTFGEYKVTSFNTYQDPVDEGGLYRFADIMFEKNGQFVGRVVVRASSNDPTFVMSYEAPILNGNVQEADKNRVMTSGLVMKFMADEGLGIFTKEQMREFMKYLPPDKQDTQFNKANLGPVEADFNAFSDAAMRAREIIPASVLVRDDEDTMTGADNVALAEPTRGGIDLNSKNLQMDVNGEKIDIRFDPATIEQFKRGDFSGVQPVIINITPITDVLPLLGLTPGREEELAKTGV